MAKQVKRPAVKPKPIVKKIFQGDPVEVKKEVIRKAPVPPVPTGSGKVAKHKDGLDDLCYGNLDKKKEHTFPERENKYYHLRGSRSMQTPSGAKMEDPGSIRYLKYDITRFKHDEKSGSLQLMGLSITILHDPTIGEGATYV